MRRLAFEHLYFLQGYCDWCDEWCKALKVVGAHWHTEQDFARLYENYVIQEEP